MTPDEIATQMVAAAFERRKSTPARREYLRLAIAAAIAAERERAEKAEAERDEARAELLTVKRACGLCDERNDRAAKAREAALREALDCQPSTAENPNEDAYQRGRFDGVMEYASAILALIDKEPARVEGDQEDSRG